MPIRVNDRNALAVYSPRASVAFQPDSTSMDLASAVAERAGLQARNAAEAFSKLGKEFGAALKKREELRDAADYADAVNQMDAAALRFQNEFTDKYKGRDARGAGEVLMNFTKSQAADLAKGYEDRPELAARIRTYGDALAVKALGQGQGYEDGQEREYRKSVLGAALSKFKTAVGTASEGEVAAEKAKYLALLEQLDPGMDHGQEARALDAAETGAFFDRRLAAGDYKGAAAVLKMRGASLGEHLPAAQMKLNQAVKAAEAEARQRRAERASRDLDLFNAAVFNARITGDPAEVKIQLREMRKSGNLTERQLQSMERQAQGLEADQIGLMIQEAAKDPDAELAPIKERLAAAALPLKAVEKAKIKLGRVERQRAQNELLSMVRSVEESEAKDTAPVWARFEELKPVLSERQGDAFTRALQGLDAKRIGAKAKDAEATLSVAELQEELKRGEALPEAARVALEGKVREISAAADDASTDLYASMTQLRQTVTVVEDNMRKRNSDGSSYYDAETLRSMDLRRKHALEQLNALEKAYGKDPAGTALARLQAGTSPVGTFSSTATQEELDEKILEDQRANAVPSDKVSVLPDSLKSRYSQRWHGANFSDKVRMAQELKAVHGKYAETALREISRGRRETYPDGSPKPFDGTEAETIMAAADGRADFAQAEKFLAAYSLRGKDVMSAEGKTSQDAKAVADDALQEVLKASDRYTHVIAMAQKTLNPQLNSMAKALADTGRILLLQGTEPEEAAKILDHGLHAVHADSVTREGEELPFSEWTAVDKEIPFRVTVEIPAYTTEEEVLSRIAHHGYDALQHYVSVLAGDPLDEGSAKTASGEENGGGTEDAVRNAELEDLKARRAVLRDRLEEQLIKSGWWGNDPDGDPNLLCFFDVTGAKVFAIPLRGN